MKVFSVKAEDTHDSMARITNFLTAKGFSVKSMAVGQAEEEGTTRITIAADIDDREARQMYHGLDKLISVVSVTHLNKVSTVIRQLVLLKVTCYGKKTHSVTDLVSEWGGKVLSDDSRTVVCELMEAKNSIVDIVSTLKRYGTVEVAQSGLVAL